MTQAEMRDAARGLPEEYLRNYTESFEAGIVKGYWSGTHCVVACMATPAAIPDGLTRVNGFNESGVNRRENIAVYRIHGGYSVTRNEPAFRTALYDAFTEELADRTSRNAPSVPETVTA